MWLSSPKYCVNEQVAWPIVIYLCPTGQLGFFRNRFAAASLVRSPYRSAARINHICRARDFLEEAPKYLQHTLPPEEGRVIIVRTRVRTLEGTDSQEVELADKIAEEPP
jgi:hypothetical protein